MTTKLENKEVLVLADVLFDDIFYSIKHWERGSFLTTQLNEIQRSGITTRFLEAYKKSLVDFVGKVVENQSAGLAYYDYARTADNTSFFMYPNFNGYMPLVGKYADNKVIDARSLGLMATSEALKALWMESSTNDLRSELYLKLRSLDDLFIAFSKKITDDEAYGISTQEETQINDMRLFMENHL